MHTHDNDKASRFFRSRFSGAGIFAAALLLFFLPFVQVKCGSSTLAENSGWGIATGGPWKMGSLGNAFSMMDKEKNPLQSSKALKDEVNVFALLALAAAVTGVFVSLLRFRHSSLVAMSAGLVGLLMLVAVFVQFRILLRKALSGEHEEAAGLFLKLEFTAWYYAALLFFAAAAFVAYWQYRQDMKEALAASWDFEFERQQKERQESLAAQSPPPAEEI